MGETRATDAASVSTKTQQGFLGTILLTGQSVNFVEQYSHLAMENIYLILTNLFRQIFLLLCASLRRLITDMWKRIVAPTLWKGYLWLSCMSQKSFLKKWKSSKTVTEGFLNRITSTAKEQSQDSLTRDIQTLLWFVDKWRESGCIETGKRYTVQFLERWKSIKAELLQKERHPIH
jgi:hypothetical protein